MLIKNTELNILSHKNNAVQGNNDGCYIYFTSHLFFGSRINTHTYSICLWDDSDKVVSFCIVMIIVFAILFINSTSRGSFTPLLVHIHIPTTEYSVSTPHDT